MFDISGFPAAVLAQRLARAGAPFVGSVPGDTPLRHRGPCPPGRAGRVFSAQQLLLSARTLRRPVTWTDPVTLRPRSALVAAVPVELVSPAGPLTLFGEWTDARGLPRQCWISSLTRESPGELLRLSRLTHRVEADLTAVSPQVGLTGFAGRSFEGWHRHTTLASAAHAVRVLAAGSAGGVGLHRRAG
ncbi:hypothetical protein WKI68_12215 [Streptomyces sp. MS1.HAVA.3]|uniref:Uncharacterized protein n=1 Tax=Streptomyces caledonius TaxID=3134107 RepID=A0ABU8U2B9_9ACTN